MAGRVIRAPGWKVRGWDVCEPPHSVAQVFGGTGDFRLTEHDLELLGDLLKHRFLVSRQVRQYKGQRSANRRLKRLLDEGLVARAIIPRPALFSEGDRATWEYVYGLTEFGFGCLVANEDHLAERLQGDWKAPYRRAGLKDTITHQVELADLCNGIEAYTSGADLSVSWRGRDLERIQIPGSGFGERWVTIYPDAALHFSTGDTLYVEHQRWIDADKINDHLEDYSVMFARKPWGQFGREPQVLMAVSDLTNPKQNRVKDVMGQVLDLTRRFYTLFGHLWLIRESNWRAGNWLVEPADPQKKPTDLYEITVKKYLAGPAERVGVVRREADEQA